MEVDFLRKLWKRYFYKKLIVCWLMIVSCLADGAVEGEMATRTGCH
jgi:hypothetical protein